MSGKHKKRRNSRHDVSRNETREVTQKLLDNSAELLYGSATSRMAASRKRIVTEQSNVAFAHYMPCPTCGQDWPHPITTSPTPDAAIDWTCAICLHQQIAILQRQIAIEQRQS